MNLLIVGGLFIVAVLAIVVMIFILRGEPDTNATASAPSSRPLAAEQNEPATQTPASKPSLAAQTAPVPTEDFTAGPEDPQTDEWNPIANGQFHELANELRTLHQQAQEFEYRLSVLRDRIERIEYARHNHMTIEEDVPHPSDIPSVN